MIAAWESILAKTNRKLEVVTLAFSSKKVNLFTKILIALFYWYAASPLDLIPDSIPFFGNVDDVLIIPLAYGLAKLTIKKEVWEELKNHIPEELFKVPARGITIDFEDYCVVCCTPKYSTSVVHEAGHIKNLIWKYIGYAPMVDNDEVDQYLHTYIYEVILKALNKHLAQ